ARLIGWRGDDDPLESIQQLRFVDEHPISAISILFQTMDATAGLIGNALFAARHLDGLAARDIVERTARDDPSVHLTTRVAARDIEVGESTIAAGDQIVLLLGSAAATFGAGLRPCPGERHALAIAPAMVGGAIDAGYRAGDEPLTYEPRPNLRIPAKLVLNKS